MPLFILTVLKVVFVLLLYFFVYRAIRSVASDLRKREGRRRQKRRKNQNAECRIVQLDHEEVLCNGRIREVEELAPTFRQLLLDTIERAATRACPKG